MAQNRGVGRSSDCRIASVRFSTRTVFIITGDDDGAVAGWRASDNSGALDWQIRQTAATNRQFGWKWKMEKWKWKNGNEKKTIRIFLLFIFILLTSFPQ